MGIDSLHVDQHRLNAICREFNVARLEVFGSYARGDATPTSDVDVLVTFLPDTKVGLGIIRLQQSLESLFGRPIDLLTRRSIEQSPNKYFRRFALRDTEQFYDCA
jgi:hypothetical protein